MTRIFDKNYKSMIPEPLQPFTDRIGYTVSVIATYLNVKLAGVDADFSQVVLSPSFNGILALIISLLSILFFAMKIYDQYLTTKLKKEAMGIKPKQKKQFHLLKRFKK